MPAEPVEASRRALVLGRSWPPSRENPPCPAEPLQPGRIYLRLGAVALARSKRNLRQLTTATRLGCTTVHALMRHPERVEGIITFETLAHLCAYLQCGPADLLIYGLSGQAPCSWRRGLDDDYLRPSQLSASAPIDIEPANRNDESEAEENDESEAEE
jgi:DNA-binding Xre family transcriptional regulator